MLKRPGSPRKRDNTVDFLKIKTYNNQVGYVCKKAYNFFIFDRHIYALFRYFFQQCYLILNKYISTWKKGYMKHDFSVLVDSLI